jgi:tannase/feruloyl esterase
MRILATAFALFLFTGTGAPSRTGAPDACETLATRAFPHATVTRAQLVPAGQFAGTPEGLLAPGAPSFRPYNALPEFCRVAATLAPSADSDIKMEIWMPAGSSWNGKFEAVGNGGWAGQLSIQALAAGVARGYAIATTDTGHATPGGSFAYGHPEKLTDFAYRAVHEMTVTAKAFVRAYYGGAPRLSYWNGCSTGGRQGLKEAQQYPDDFDGIVAGAPASHMTHLLAQSIWVAQAVRKAGAPLTASQYARLHQAVIDSCDASDGVKDGVIEDPRQCAFDPRAIQCTAASDDSCLTPAQVEMVRTIYAPARNPRTGADIFPGQERGSELAWSTALAAPTPLGIATDYWKYVVFANPDWDFMTLNFDADVARAEALDHGEMNVVQPDLNAFVTRGGKLLLYHGWNDPLIAPRNTVNYFEAAVKTLGGAGVAKDSVRLFMMPGVGHCVGGEGPSNFDQLGVMEQWVEQRHAPDAIVAARTSPAGVDRTRPLCPYPQVAVYRGSGDTNVADNFTCKAR